MEKLLIECTLEIFAAGLVAGIQDLGGAGLSCATSELASAGDGGMHVELDRVPLRDSTLAPEEILMSESQERMMAVVEPGDVEAFMAICAQVGRRGRRHRRGHRRRAAAASTGTARPSSTSRPRTVAHEGPTYQRPFARPDWQDALQADSAEALPRPATGDELRDTVLRLVASPEPLRQVVDHRPVRPLRAAATPCWPSPSDSGMIRIDEETNLGVAVATDCNGRFALLDPYAGAQLALAESYRNVATGGARPLAISDCLNFGSPEDPAVMWQFAEACRGLKDACVELGIPVTGGNVSLYNQTGETADPADPGGRRARGDRRRHAGVRRPASRPPASRCSCSARPARSCPARSGRTSCTATSADARRVWTSRAEKALGELLAEASALLTSAHDLSDGGLAQALVGVLPAARDRRARWRWRGRPVRRAVQPSPPPACW